MIRIAFHNPKAQAWQRRLSRIPRWGWVIIGVAVILPIVVLLASIVAVALVAGAIAIAVVMLLLALRGLWLQLIRPRDDGRRNVRIVVRPGNLVD